MLQQTTVKAVAPYYAAFLARWPDVTALAAAPEDAVMAAWAGLGYYSRARNLKRCAEAVVADHGGGFPETATALRALPGIGPYTAAAIAAIAFDEGVAVVDGNVERVAARQMALETPLPQAKPIIHDFVSARVPSGRSGDFAQAMMDLGATICSPRTPACALCPVANTCLGRAEAARFPVKAPRADKPKRVGAAFVIRRGDGAIWLQRRPPKGLLASMAQVPTTDWTAREDGATSLDAAPIKAEWRACGTVTHVFTHFALTLHVYETVAETCDGTGWWSRDLASEALPALMRRVIAATGQDNHP